MTSTNTAAGFPQPPAGHLIGPAATPGGGPEYTGQRGTAYQYLMAGNGLFVEAHNSVMDLRINLVQTEIRGLAAESETVSLAAGRIPRTLLTHAVRLMRGQTGGDGPMPEVYLEIRAVDDATPTHADEEARAGRYALLRPQQEGREDAVRYRRDESPSRVAELHSHGDAEAFFSGTDDQDEQGLGLYVVVGRLRPGTACRSPQHRLRAGIYGHFRELPMAAIFASGRET